MNRPPHTPWSRLVSAARARPEERGDETAPPGFATRVVALARAQRVERPLLALVERLSWRALGAAGAIAVASVAVNFAPVVNAIERDVHAANDPVVTLLDLAH